ncbi:hypothetical protein QYM36_017754 [Artemia franciscana]|uniref:Uncharacterized protein n=1 Tax=Artemia franciscana TaxID=6661 RepID=A0AA88H3E9_ARTSF|nr:hypothetical protein QYM36_017754 [Artemia franciscana]
MKNVYVSEDAPLSVREVRKRHCEIKSKSSSKDIPAWVSNTVLPFIQLEKEGVGKVKYKYNNPIPQLAPDYESDQDTLGVVPESQKIDYRPPSCWETPKTKRDSYTKHSANTTNSTTNLETSSCKKTFSSWKTSFSEEEDLKINNGSLQGMKNKKLLTKIFQGSNAIERKRTIIDLSMEE